MLQSMSSRLAPPQALKASNSHREGAGNSSLPFMKFVELFNTADRAATFYIAAKSGDLEMKNSGTLKLKQILEQELASLEAALKGDPRQQKVIADLKQKAGL